MKLVVFDSMPYESYKFIRDTLFLEIPFAIINAEFCNNKGYFFFWDESYIPSILKVETSTIFGNKQKVEKVNEILEEKWNELF